MLDTIERRPVTLIAKWGSRALVDDRFHEPRIELIRPNVATMATIIKDEGARVINITSGARLLGRGKLQKNRSYLRYIKDREGEIHGEYEGDQEELERNLREFRNAQIRHEHRIGQRRLMGILGYEFGKHGVNVNEELLDGGKVDLALDIQLAAQKEALVYNGNGALDPYSRSGDNDLNLREVVEWADPDNPDRKLVVVSVMHPNTPGLLDSHHRIIPVYRGARVTALQHRDRTVSTGGPVSKTRIMHDIKTSHPDASVILSGMSEDVIENALLGRGGTIVELRHRKQSPPEVQIAS